jgi:hypothetical protein
MEIWKDITGYEGLYQVSNYGRVKNKDKILNGCNFRGYLQVYLSHPKKSFLIHRLVAKEFFEEYDSYKMVNHIDFDKTNNHLSNLEMVSNRENQCHSVKAKKKYIGVSFHIRNKKWSAHIMVNGVLKHLGTFENELKAYEARIKFEKENCIINKYI